MKDGLKIQLNFWEVKTMDKYVEKRREAVKNSKTNEEIDTVLNRTYNDGFEDGCDMNE